MSRSGTADVASAARVRWDLAIPSRVGAPVGAGPARHALRSTPSTHPALPGAIGPAVASAEPAATSWSGHARSPFTHRPEECSMPRPLGVLPMSRSAVDRDGARRTRDSLFDELLSD